MFVAPDPVSSGRPYQIVESSAGTPDDLNQFVGEASFTIDNDGTALVICGLGAADGSGVRFLEKDLEHSGKDVRSWNVAEDPAGSFVATPLATY